MYESRVSPLPHRSHLPTLSTLTHTHTHTALFLFPSLSSYIYIYIHIHMIYIYIYVHEVTRLSAGSGGSCRGAALQGNCNALEV